MVGEALVSLKLNAHINPVQVTIFSSLLAHSLQATLVSQASCSLHSHSKNKHICFTPLVILK